MAAACLVPASRCIRSVADVRALFATLAMGTAERCGFAYLDPEWTLLGLRETPPGTAYGVGVPLRDVVADVLAWGAKAVVMVHNHPGGDTTPSAADIVVTKRLLAVLEAIDARLVDHVVLSPTGHASMRDMGLL